MELFSDPELFLRLRERVVPELRTWPWPNVWVAGCGTGELAYALAIVLREEVGGLVVDQQDVDAVGVR